MSIFSRKKKESDFRSVLTVMRASMYKLKQLDDAEKEKCAEHLRHLWAVEANLAEQISKTNPREGKKLTRQSEEDEAELERFLVELGVGRYSPETQ